MSLVQQSLQIVPSLDGSCYGTNPLGDKVSNLSWASDLSSLQAIIAIKVQNSGAISTNVRGFLSGSGAATATITVVSVSGTDAATGGWSISTDNLVNPVTGTGSGFFKLSASQGGSVAVSGIVSWTLQAVPTDTLGPVIPTGLMGTPATNSIIWTWDAAQDPHDGTVQGSGIKNYDLELNGNVTIVSGLAGIVDAPTVSNIGSISSPGAPTAVQSGKNWTLTAAGTGVDTSPDQFLFLNWQVSGNCTLVCKVNSFTGSGASFAEAGLMVRESLAQDSRYCSAYQFLVSSAQGVQGKTRVVTGGAKVGFGTTTGTNTARYLKLTRVADTFTTYYSLDGLTWTQFGTASVPMNATVYIGAFTTSFLAGTNVVAQINELNVGTNPALTYTQSTVTATTARIRARDLHTPTANLGSYSSTTPSVTPIVTVQSKKFNSGFYAGSENPTYADDRKRANQTLEQNLVLSSGSKVLGWKGSYKTAALCSPTNNVFDFSKLFVDLNKLRSMSPAKRLMILFTPQEYGGLNYANILPPWVYNTSSFGASPIAGKYGFQYIHGGTGVTAAFWRTAVMDFFIQMYTALASAINPATGLTIDDDPFVEALITWETSTPPDAGDATYTTTSISDQFKRLIDACVTLFPKTQFWVQHNFVGNKTLSQDMTNYIYAKGCGQSGPDTFVAGQKSPDMTWGQLAAIGVGQTEDTTFNGPDLRGRILMCSSTEGPEISSNKVTGGRYNMYTPMTFFNKVNDVLQQPYWVPTMISISATNDPIPAYPATGPNTGTNPGNWHSIMQVINGQTLSHMTKPTSIP